MTALMLPQGSARAEVAYYDAKRKKKYEAKHGIQPGAKQVTMVHHKAVGIKPLDEEAWDVILPGTAEILEHKLEGERYHPVGRLGAVLGGLMKKAVDTLHRLGAALGAAVRPSQTEPEQDEPEHPLSALAKAMLGIGPEQEEAARKRNHKARRRERTLAALYLAREWLRTAMLLVLFLGMAAVIARGVLWVWVH